MREGAGLARRRPDAAGDYYFLPTGGVGLRCTALHAGWLADLALNPAMRPQRIIALQAAPLLAGDRLLAFHGTSFENMHSILHNGLLNLSGTRLERTGSAFGQGIYLSTEMSVAYAFSLAADACRSAVLGGRLRCLLVCGVEREHAAAAQGDGVSEAPPELAQRNTRSSMLWKCCEDAGPWGAESVVTA